MDDYDYDHDRATRSNGDRQWPAESTGIKVYKPFCHRLPVMEPELWRDFDEYLTNRNLSPHVAKANRWYPMRSENFDDDNYGMGGRIVIPATSKQVGNHFYQSRIMYDGPGDYKRYDSPYAERGDAVIVVYPQGPTIWNESVVVEGPMCALAAAQTGRLGIALMGADPLPEPLHLTSELIRGTICYVIPDNDRLLALTYVMMNLANRGNNCKLITIEGANDLAALSSGNRAKLFERN